MKIPVTLLDFSGEVKDLSTCWDMALIKDIVEGKVWQPAQGYQFAVMDSYLKYGFKPKKVDHGAVFVIPGRQNAGQLDKIQAYISDFAWCLLIITGDEERSFDYKQLKHPKMKIWLMAPTLDDQADFYLSSGYTPNTRKEIAKWPDLYLNKPYDWAFLGQNNHPRRQQAIDVLSKMCDRDDMKGDLLATEGFTHGHTPDIYYQILNSAKAAPCPSGVQSPDSFRVGESLEAGAVPIADDLSTMLVHEPGYWRKVFNGEEVPFKIFDDYSNLEGYIADVKRLYPAYNNKVFAWWQSYKRRMTYTLVDHIHELSGIEPAVTDIRNLTTVLMPTSPVPSNPSTEHIERTIDEVRKQLPDSEIIIMIDGVRAEQEECRPAYNEYIKRLLWLTNFKYHNILPLIFETHSHQANMTREALKYVRTPTITFVEHDAPIVSDEPIEWGGIINCVLDGTANIIRLHHEGQIPEAHKYLMIGEPEVHNGVSLLKTAQYSQRPHIASTAFYRQMIDTYFGPDSLSMIEDVAHSVLLSLFNAEGVMGWNLWKLWVYHPMTGNIKRSYHIDARGSDKKYGMKISYKGETPRFAPEPKVTGDEEGK